MTQARGFVALGMISVVLVRIFCREDDLDMDKTTLWSLC